MGPTLLLAVTLLAPPVPSIPLRETSVAASGRNVVVAVIKAAPLAIPSEIDVFASSDAGASWSGAILTPTATVDGTSYMHASDPTVVALDDGSFGLSYVLFSTNSVGLVFDRTAMAYTRSTDGGRSWSPPIALVAHTNPSSPDDKPVMTFDGIRGVVYVVWTLGANPRLVMAKSTDRGVHWTAPAPVTPDSGDTLAQLAALPDGTLVLLTFQAAGARYVSRVSTDNGQTFGDPQTVAGNARFYTTPGTKTVSGPMATMIEANGVLDCAMPTASGVAFTQSRDDGKTWSTPIPLGGQSGDAVLPAVAASGSEIIVTWLDGRDAPSGMLRLYAARSRDGGTTFETPRAFSDPFVAGGPLGDYNGVAMVAVDAAITAFAAADGSVYAAGIQFENALHHRAARH